MLQEIDHVGYVRQAIGAASLNYFDEILHSNLLKDSEVGLSHLFSWAIMVITIF